MNLNINWRQAAKMIQELNTGEGLGMVHGTFVTGPEPWAGSTIWGAGNSYIILNSVEEKSSVLELRVGDEPADERALLTWQRLERRLRPGDIVQARGKPGRRHLPEDEWAWRQVHTHQRNQSEVYAEWSKNPKVQARHLVDPNRQFRRIIKPEWMTK